MKKILLALTMLLLFAVQAHAVGTCTKTSAYNGINVRTATYTCTDDAADADNTAFTATITGFGGFYLYTVETWPGTTAPTDDSDYTLKDGEGEDLMGAYGTDGIDATTKETHIPKSTAADLNLYPIIHGDLTLAITNQNVESAIIYFRITGVK